MPLWETLIGATHCAPPRSAVCHVTPPRLDTERAAPFVQCLTREAGLHPALGHDEALALLDGFLSGDHTPFVICSKGRSMSAEGDTDVADLLVFAVLLAVRNQWVQTPRVVRETALDLSEPGADLCPTCGSIGGLEVISGEDGRRYLACPVCDTLWRVNRVGCPRCGESDGKKLAVISDPTEPGRAVVHCHACNRAWRRRDAGKEAYPDGETLHDSLLAWAVEEALADTDYFPIPLRPTSGTTHSLS